MIEAVTTSPLFGIVLCIGTFQIGRWVQKKTGLTLANPLVIAILLCIGVLFYGIAMLILRLSGSATMAVLALLLYELLNEFAMSDAFVFYKVYGSLTVEIFCVRYVPLLVIALVCILLAFTANGHAGRAAD